MPAVPATRPAPSPGVAHRTAARSDSAADASHLGLASVLDALEGWCTAPSAGARRRLVKALHGFAEARQVPGVFLEVTAPLPPLAVGAGSLARRPGRGRLRAGTVVERRLRAGDPPRQVGTLLVAVADPRAPVGVPAAAAPAAAAPAVEAAGTGMARLLEMALRGALARAEARASADRLEALDEATRAIAGVLSTERVLQLIVDSVRRLVGAEYAALGIVDAGRRLDPFITSGMSRARPRPDRLAAPRPRAPRRDPRGQGRDPGGRHRRRSAAPRLPPEPPGHARLSRCSHQRARPRHRQPLPHRQGRAARRGRAGSARRTSGSSSSSRAMPGSPSRTPGSTRRSNSSRCSRSASGSDGTCTTGSSRASTPSGSRSTTRTRPCDEAPRRPRRRSSARSRSSEPHHPRHPQLHLRAAAGAVRPGRPRRRPCRHGRGVPGEHDGRHRASRSSARATWSSPPTRRSSSST